MFRLCRLRPGLLEHAPVALPVLVSGKRAGGGFEGDVVLSSEREDEAELEHMMGNARTAPRYSAVKQYVLKGWGKCDKCGWRNSYLC